MKLLDSDRHFTSPTILAAVAEQWPEGISLDPCWDPESAGIVDVARAAMAERQIVVNVGTMLGDKDKQQLGRDLAKVIREAQAAGRRY